jgi:hypothetical protein
MTGSGLAIVDNIKMGYAFETTPGTIPAAAFQTLRPKGQSLDASLKYKASDEFRADRQVSDQVLIDASPAGQISGEISFGSFDDFLQAVMSQSAWTNLLRQTGVSVTSTSVFTIPSGGAAAVANHVVRAAGFATAGNNGLFPVASSTGTTVTVSGTPLTIETSGAAKSLRIWGFTSTSGDITATASGLASTTLDFTTLGLAIGQILKIGGPLAANQFATAANKGLARITAIAAHALTLDNLPVGWATDTGTGKTIYVQISDRLQNGVTPQSFTIERWHTDITQFFQFMGMYIDKLTLNLTPAAILDAQFDFKGVGYALTQTTASTGSYVAAPTTAVMNAVNGVPKIQEGGNNTGYLKKMTLTAMNNTREQKAVGTLGNVGIGFGKFAAQITFEAYFTSATLYNKYLAATLTSLMFATSDPAGNYYVFTLPAVKLSSAKISAAGINQDVTMQVTADALIDTVSGVMMQIDRIPA